MKLKIKNENAKVKHEKLNGKPYSIPIIKDKDMENENLFVEKAGFEN